MAVFHVLQRSSERVPMVVVVEGDVSPLEYSLEEIFFSHCTTIEKSTDSEI